MTITITDKHLGEVIDFDELCEYFADPIRFSCIIESEDGYRKDLYFSKKDFEIHIG